MICAPTYFAILLVTTQCWLVEKEGVKVGGRSEQPRGLEGDKRAGNALDWGGRRVI
jgi:hypothetical protein